MQTDLHAQQAVAHIYHTQSRILCLNSHYSWCIYYVMMGSREITHNSHTGFVVFATTSMSSCHNVAMMTDSMSSSLWVDPNAMINCFSAWSKANGYYMLNTNNHDRH